MIVLILTAFVVAGGLTIDAQPVEKQRTKIVYKKAIQYTKAMQEAEELKQFGYKVEKLIDTGPGILERCPINRCTVRDLQEVL